MKQNLKFHFRERCTFAGEVFQQKRVFGGFEAAEPVLDPVPVHLPLVQAEEESRLLASARASQSLSH